MLNSIDTYNRITKKPHKICIALLALTLLACNTLGSRTVRISEAELQAKLAKKLTLPITILKIFDMQLSNPLIKLDASTSRLSTRFDADLKNPFGKMLKGQARISGLPRFDAQTNSVVLSQVKIESLNVDGFDQKIGDILNTLARQVSGEILNDIPLYTLKADDLKIGNTTYLPSDFKVLGNQLQVTLFPQ